MPGKEFHLPIIQTQTTTESSCNNNNEDDDDADDNGERKRSSTMTKTKVTFKQEFILHLKPIVQEMEHRKETDMMESRSATQCEMHKNKGRCYYFDIDTGEEVDSREYERRYLRWIERRRVERLDDNRRRRERDDEVGKGGKNDEELVLSSPQLGDAEEEGSSDCESSFDMDQSVNMDESMMSSVASSVDDATTYTTNIANIATASRVAASSAAAPNTTTMSRISGSIDPSGNDTNGNTSNSNSSGSSILGLPSLPPSNDARVLDARNKLWRAIDVALENYSKEILAIQQGI